MKTMFFRTLIAFIGSLCVFLIVLFIPLYSGYTKSADKWGEEKLEEIISFSQGYLQNPGSGELSVPPADIPLFILNDRKELLFSNRGKGTGKLKSLAPEDYTPIYSGDNLLGYVWTQNYRFQDDEANQKFLESMKRSIYIGAMIALPLFLVLAFFLSKSLSGPAEKIAQGLRRMSQGNLTEEIPEKGAMEITRIARSANILSQQLFREKELRRQWTEDIAHDLRTPVSAMKAQFQGIADRVLDLSIERIKKNILELERFEKLINDLEELTRLESPEMAPDLKDIHAQGFFRNIQERFESSLKTQNIDFSFSTDTDKFYGDEDLLHRALSNIMSNAIRHTGKGGIIRITLEKKKNDLSTGIKIFNSGEPISQNDADNVFERLYRGEKARSTPGSGLGLTIAKKIVLLHQGSIKIEGVPRKGTIIEIRLFYSGK